MRNYLLAAVAAAALTSPALARDKSMYVGVEGGVMLVEDTEFDLDVDGEDTINEAYSVDHKIGYDFDLIAGYDFGSVRAEAEIAYKRASLDEIILAPAIREPNDLVGAFDINGKVSVLSLMGNLLLDFGDEDGWAGYVGGGLGIAGVKYTLNIPGLDDGDTSDKDSGLAWQIIAGVRKSITPNLDLGLKYRMFTVNNVRLGDDVDGELAGRLRTHSLLLSLIYNFWTPVPPPPPPPPPPATQTCPDGSVILATDACPPPPPPPPPPPEPERG